MSLGADGLGAWGVDRATGAGVEAPGEIDDHQDVDANVTDGAQDVGDDKLRPIAVIGAHQE